MLEVQLVLGREGQQMLSHVPLEGVLISKRLRARGTYEVFDGLQLLDGDGPVCDAPAVM